MIDAKFAPYAALVLRVGCGIMFLAHGLRLKAFMFSLPGTAQTLEFIGLPVFLTHLVFAAETVGGMLLIVGYTLAGSGRWCSQS